MGRRRAHRAPAAAQPARARTPAHRRRHRRADPPARRRAPRPPDRRDPQQARPAHRNRPGVHRGTRPRDAPARRHPRRPDRTPTASSFPSTAPPASSASRPQPSDAGSKTACSRASKRRPTHPGESGSTKRSAPASCPTSPTDSSRSTRPRTVSASRQTVLHQVQRGQRRAIEVTQGRRRGLRIDVRDADAGLLDRP